MSAPVAHGDPEHDVLAAARAAVSPPAGAMIPVAALEGAIAEALGMAAENRADEDGLDLEPDQRYGAGQAAFAQECVIACFQRLLLDAA